MYNYQLLTSKTYFYFVLIQLQNFQLNTERFCTLIFIFLIEIFWKSIMHALKTLNILKFYWNNCTERKVRVIYMCRMFSH